MKTMKKILSVILAVFLLVSAIPFTASAVQTVTRTQTLDLNDAEFAQDCENAAEGWSWDVDTLTLTLNSANFDTGEDDGIIIVDKETTTIKMQGESTFVTNGNGKSVARDSGGSVIFEGNGTLNVNYTGEFGSIEVGSMGLKSGTLNIIGGTVFIMNGVEISGGNLNIDTVGYGSNNGQGQDGFYILGDGLNITGGNVVIRAERTAVFVQGESSYDTINYDKGLVIKGGDVTLYGGMCAAWIGYTYNREIVIDTTGTVTIEGSKNGLGLYCGMGTMDIKRGIINNPDNLAADKLFRVPDGAAVISPADYYAVDAALAKVPADLTAYTEESVAPLQTAIDAVDRELNVLEQKKVNDYAVAIEAALEGLEESSFMDKVAKFFENLFNGETNCPVLKWIINVFNVIVNFFTGLFVK